MSLICIIRVANNVSSINHKNFIIIEIKIYFLTKIFLYILHTFFLYILVIKLIEVAQYKVQYDKFMQKDTNINHMQE